MPAVIKDGKVIITTNVVELNDTTGEVLYTAMPPYQKFVLRKLIIYNQDSADHVVTIGEYNTMATPGNEWVEDKLVIPVAAGEFKVLKEEDLPADFVMTTDPASAIYAWAGKLEAAVTANPVKVKAEFVVL